MVSKMDREGSEDEDSRGGDERALAAEESGRGRNKWRVMTLIIDQSPAKRVE